jgi:nuclear transport factor 2 (NTF2) superfamily protein
MELMPAMEATQELSLDAAIRMVRAVEEAFATSDIPRIIAGFTPDVIVRFGDFPEMHGRDQAEQFIRARFARQRNYRLRKTLRAVMGNVIGNVWEGEWEDAVSGKPMQGRGVEFWTIQDGRIAIWEAAFNVWEVGGGPLSPIV